VTLNRIIPQQRPQIGKSFDRRRSAGAVDSTQPATGTGKNPGAVSIFD